MDTFNYVTQCAQTMIGQRCWRIDPVHAFHWSVEHALELYSLQRLCRSQDRQSASVCGFWPKSTTTSAVYNAPLNKDTPELIQSNNYGFRSVIRM